MLRVGIIFLDIKKINPRSANTFISRGKKESSASLDKRCFNPHFLDRNFFPPLLYARIKVGGKKGIRGMNQSCRTSEE